MVTNFEGVPAITRPSSEATPPGTVGHDLTRTHRVRSPHAASMFTTTLLYAALLPFAAASVTAFALLRFHVAPRHVWAASVAAGFIAAQLGFKAQTSVADAWQSIL